MKVTELLENKSIAARKEKEASSSVRGADFKKKFPKDAENYERQDNEVNEILSKIFGTKSFREYTTGYEGGEAAGKKYNAMMNKLGFTEMEAEGWGDRAKPIPAWGPKPELRTKWKVVGKVKSDYGNFTFYQLKDSPKIVVMQTDSAEKYSRTLYVQR